MYEVDLIKSTKLAKKLGGPPIFNDGFLQKVTLSKEQVVFNIKILSQNNPLLSKDTDIYLKLYTIHKCHFSSDDTENGLLIIHNIDIRKEGEFLRLILESNRGEISEFVFDYIELEPAT